MIEALVEVNSHDETLTCSMVTKVVESLKERTHATRSQHPGGLDVYTVVVLRRRADAPEMSDE